MLSHSWCLPPDERTGWLEVDLTQSPSIPVEFNTLVLSEPIGRWKEYRQTRISHYRFLVLVRERWREVFATADGIERTAYEVNIHQIPRVRATRVRLEIRGRLTEPEPHVMEVGVYNEPEQEP